MTQLRQNFGISSAIVALRKQNHRYLLTYYLPSGTQVAKRLKMPLITIDPQASHLLPHMSSVKVRKVSAGNSVADAIVNVRKTSSPNVPTFLTCPSNTREIAIQMTISSSVMFLRRGVLNRSSTV